MLFYPNVITSLFLAFEQLLEGVGLLVQVVEVAYFEELVVELFPMVHFIHS